MNDPAIDAAQRVIVGRVSSAHPDDLTAAAREALKPIREELDKLAKATEPPCNWEIWTEAYAEAVDRISHHCFSTEEMNR
ncbi:hypothetical protein [Mycolicibacterium llatzerense]|uniref:hypothetical protein n=1 Tax=Mycolicibacterium llatzerense TaxID=280871 RepID=UPI0021B63491|nr:hypothetical protein [Mycolicibacterium llatzerense]